jgi:hypothetical protein
MAKVKLGALAQDVRGTIAGQTFSRNKGGSYVRQKVSGTQPQTARQTAQRSILSQVSIAWANTEAATRALWYAYAENNPVLDVFGDSLKLNGAAVFAKLNAIRVTCGQAIIATPPVAEAPAAILFNTVVADETLGIYASYKANVPATSGVMFFGWATEPNQGALPKSKLRFIGYKAGSASSTLELLLAEINNPLVALKLGQRLHLRLVQIEIASGRVLGSTTTSVLVQSGP